MGKTIVEVANKRGHNLISIIDNANDWDKNESFLKSADVVFEFTKPDSAPDNILKCFNFNLPVVCGTTGWLDKFENIKNECINKGKTLFYSSNFSIGVNILMELNRQLAIIMNNFSQYIVNIEETHHIHKLDSPSGTAIVLAKDIIKKIQRLKDYNTGKSGNSQLLDIISYREDEIAGIHNIIYESDVDIIELKHTAKNRKGLAEGAVLAAEWVQNRRGGVYSMYDLLGFGSM